MQSGIWSGFPDYGFPAYFCHSKHVFRENSNSGLKKVRYWSVKGPTENLYILIAEVVLMTVWGGVFPNRWE